MNKEEVFKLVGITGDFRGWTFDTSEQMLAFANACEKIGMEKAAKICDEHVSVGGIAQRCAETICKEIK